MPIPVVVPRLGWTMEQGVFVEWLKQDGDTVQMGDPLFVLEGEKATQDIESTDAGVLIIPADSPKSGDIIAVGATIGYLSPAGEEKHTPGDCASLSVVATWDNGKDIAEISLLRRSTSSACSSESACHREDRILSKRISPRARRIAKELGLDWAQVPGTGSSGRIRESDIRAFNALQQVEDEPRDLDEPRSVGKIPVTKASIGDLGTTPKRVHQGRRIIADQMLANAQLTAPVTLTTHLDATHLVSLRKQFQAAATVGEVIPSYTDILVKLAAIALKLHPDVNSMLDDQGNIVSHEESHIGIAVDTPMGLLVPVMRSVGRLTLRQVTGRTRELIERTRQRTLSPFELQGGTFTITNMGMLGVESFTPLLFPPQAATLGVGRITREPAVIGDQIVARDRMILSLTFDHRILDGAPAARFLNTLSNLIANPAPALIS